MEYAVKNELLSIFYRANKDFLIKDESNILRDVSERSLCASLKSQLEKHLDNTRFREYYVDAEYNRNEDKIKAILTDRGTSREAKVKVVCDLIVHSRGEKPKDNLIAIEMKKRGRDLEKIKSDADRLMALTNKQSSNFHWEGSIDLETVSDYELGILYIIDTKHREIELRFFSTGIEVGKSTYSFEYYKTYNK